MWTCISKAFTGVYQTAAAQVWQHHCMLVMVSAQVVDKTTRNALDVLDWIGLNNIGEA